VLVSNDGFAHYTSSNQGFSHRAVHAVVVDRKDPNRLYAGVANDKEQGGLFLSDDSGKNWRQSSRGLAGRDILSLQQAEDGALFAGTNHGIFRLESVSASWTPMKMIQGPMPEAQPAEPSPASKGKSAAANKRAAAVAKTKAATEAGIPAANAPRVRSLQMSDKAWFAATDDGLFISVDRGERWYGQAVEGEREFSAVNSYDDGTVTLAGLKGAYISHDDGKTWTSIALPKYVSEVYSLTVTPGALWLGTRQGGLRSANGGQTWQYILGGLPKDDVLAVRYDSGGQRLLATALHSHAVFESKDGGQSWQSTPEAGVSIRTAMNYKGRLLVATFYNGLLLEEASGTASQF
jgi:photosystem II stability/assembly factor-like uncharacterized protein